MQNGQNNAEQDQTDLANQGGEIAQATGAQQQDRSLGDKLQDIHRMINEILERSGDDARLENKQAEEQAAKQVEHVREDEDSEMQALGAAGPEDHEKLADLAIVDEQAESHDQAMDVDEEPSDDPSSRQENSNSHVQDIDVKPDVSDEKALTRSQIDHRGDDMVDAQNTSDSADALLEDDDTKLEAGEHSEDKPDSSEVELALQSWIESGRDDQSGEDLWRRYSTLTSDLSYHLCEQLRLILQPTLATRLQGDYRTGKRLNMRKIIPYIASEYTKDKIWLRRTKPSRREYQVLLSLDDSRSMADTKSVHLAYQTLALVSQALTKLEVGQIGIARFGENVEILHDFNSNAFSDAEGSRIMNTFTFQQHRTDVAKLVGNSLDVLADARRAQSTSSSGDLWQLEIIISDGVCQDHAQLRKLLRRALQERVMIVFLVIDSLKPPPSSTETAAVTANRPSILNMQTVAYKEVNGEMKIEMERYLDTFPFEYYVVLRDVEALPEVLSETLRQWMARVSTSEE
jgi:midasin